MALTGCTDPSTLYENNDLVAQGTTAYKAAEWSQSSLTDDGTIDYAAGAVSLTGAKEAFSFTMHADSANLDVYDTITCDTGACKILIVDTDTKSVAAEYTETAYDTIKLNGGNYTVYLVGKDDRAVYRKVKVLFEHQGVSVVEGELAEGDRVVVDGQVRLAPGLAVQVLE